jgi:hypothetical protein
VEGRHFGLYGQRVPAQLPPAALDENADVLADMAEGGDDLSKARDIDFSHLFPDATMAAAFAEWAASEGYSCDIEESDGPECDVTVSRFMVPELETITGVEHTLAVAAARYGGQADGWGCFAVPKLHS